MIGVETQDDPRLSAAEMERPLTLGQIYRRAKAIEAWVKTVREEGEGPTKLLEQVRSVRALVTVAGLVVGRGGIDGREGEEAGDGDGGQSRFLHAVARAWAHDTITSLGQVEQISMICENQPQVAVLWQEKMDASLGRAMETCGEVERFIRGEWPVEELSGKQVEGEIMGGIDDALGVSAWPYLSGGFGSVERILCHRVVVGRVGLNIGFNIADHVLSILKGGISELKLSLGAERRENLVDLWVADNGKGYNEIRRVEGFVETRGAHGRGHGMACWGEILRRKYNGELLPAVRLDGLPGARTIIRLPLVGRGQ